MKKVAIIGTQGVPACYGGFESLVENIIGEKAGADVQYTVFCSSRDLPTSHKEYKGCRLRYTRLHANGMQSVPYDIISMLKACHGFDAIVVLGVSGCIFLPVLRVLTRAKIIVNIDGIEHRRDKWNTTARRFLKISEQMAVRFAHEVIADNKGIQEYVSETYGKPTRLIAYGGDQVALHLPPERQAVILAHNGLTAGDYAITVCRIEPENNCHITLEAFARTDRTLVFIGNWHHSEYARALYDKYKHLPHFHLKESIYDPDILYTLRANASSYVHGHSAGGTNPSLVEAMFFGRPIYCYDVVYNRETTHGAAAYFHDADSLLELLDGEKAGDGEELRRIAESEYRWAKIARQYEALY